MAKAVASQNQMSSVKQQIEAANRAFMRGSLERTAYCPVTGGSGVSASYSAGTTLYFDLPVEGGAYVTDLLITYNLTVNPATANGASYALNAAAPWSMFSEIKLDYGPTQVRTHPFFLKCLDMLKGVCTGAQNQVLSGQNDQTVSNQVCGPTPIVVNTNNTWQGKMLLRLNALGKDSVPGVLPIMGTGNKPQLKLTCTPNFLGNDPLLNPISGSGGTNPSATVTGTINVDALYLDGVSTANAAPMQLNLNGEPTLQYYWDSALTPFTTGNVQWKQISVLLEHWYAVAIVIDAVQSNQFATIPNILGFALGADTSGQNLFQSWNISNNISVYDYYDRFRRIHGQDMDPGVIVWADAPGRGVINADNRNGHQVLNMQPNGGYTAMNHRYQMNSIGSVCTPRVELFLVSMNYDGLRLV